MKLSSETFLIYFRGRVNVTQTATNSSENLCVRKISGSSAPIVGLAVRTLEEAGGLKLRC